MELDFSWFSKRLDILAEKFNETKDAPNRLAILVALTQFIRDEANRLEKNITPIYESTMRRIMDDMLEKESKKGKK